jgi:hypothetical protein
MNGVGAEARREKRKTLQGSLSPSAEVASSTPTVSAFGSEQASAGNAALAGAAVGAYRERTVPPLLLQKTYGNAAVGYAATRSPALIAPRAEIASARSQEGEEFDELAPADKKAELAQKKDVPATPEIPPAEEPVDAKAGVEAEKEPDAKAEELALPAGGEDKGTPPRTRAKAEAEPEAPGGAPGMPGLPTAPAAADVHVSGSSPGDVLASLANVPPSQFARGLSEAEGASKTALADQAQATRAEIPELKTPTGMPPVGDPGAITTKAASTAAAAAAAAGSSVARTPLKPGAGKQEVKTPVVQPQRSPEPTRLSGPEQPTGDPKTDAKMAHDAQAELATVAVDDRGIPKDAGTPEPIKLDKDANPARMDEESRKQAQEVDRAVQAERHETNRDFGENAIAPAPDDSMIVTKVGVNGRRLGKLKGPAGPSDAELAAGFDASLGPKLNRRVLDQKTEYDSEEQRFATDKEAAHEHTREEIAALERDTAKQQTGHKVEAQKEVAAQREGWRKEIGDHQAKYDKAAEGAVAETRGKVALEKQEGERKIAGHYAEANRKIAKEHEDAKVKEEAKRKEAKNRSSGFFGWIRRKAAALIDWLKDAVNFIYDNVRKAVKAAINLVKDAVNAVIDLVRDAVVGLIKGLAAGLKLLVNIALVAFPETRRRINAKIDAGVAMATKFVNDAADKLKKGVSAALDLFASAIDKLLGLIQSIYSGILTFVSMVVSGEFEEIIRRLGYLVTAAKTVPDVFEQAALEELLGGNLDEPLSAPELQFAAANNLLPEISTTERGTGAVEGDLTPKPPYSEDNVDVDAVDHDFELSPEMEAELLNELEGDESGTLEIGGADDRSRSIAAILEEAKGGAEQSTGEDTEHEAGPAMSDGLTPTQRAKVKWEMMKDGIAKWWSDNWGKVLLAATAAIVGFIALNIVTGGGVMAVLAALMPILTPLFIGVTVVTLASHAKDYVEKGWEGQIRPAGKSLAHGLAAGAIELISWLTFKAGSAALRGAKAVAKGGLKLAQAGARGAQRLGTTALRAAKAVVARGRIILQGLGKTKIGKMFTRLSQLGDELLTRLRFRKFRIVLEGRRFRLEGFINPWILLADGTVKWHDVDGPYKVGDVVKVPGEKQGAFIIGKRGKPIKGAPDPTTSAFVDDLAPDRVMAKAKYAEIKAAKPADRRELIMGLSKTAENAKVLRADMLANGKKLLDGEHAHHLVPSTHPYSSAKKARAILDKFNVKINSHFNGAALSGSVHAPLHSYEYMDEVLRILQGARSREAVIARLKQVENLILGGHFSP